MKIAVALLTCDRYDYTVKTVESFLEHNNPDDFQLFHGDDASTNPRVVEYVQSKGFETLVQHTERSGCSPITRELFAAVEERTSPETLLLYLQNDFKSLRPIPLPLVHELLEHEEHAFVQLSYRSPGRHRMRRQQWWWPDGVPWEYPDTSRGEYIVTNPGGLQAYHPAIATVETWRRCIEKATKEPHFIRASRRLNKRMVRLTPPVVKTNGRRTTPNGKFGRGWKDRKGEREATRQAPVTMSTIGIAAPAYGVKSYVVRRFQQFIPKDAQTAIHVRPVAGTFNLARAKNRAIRELLDKCKIVVAVDVDCIIPPGLMEALPEVVRDGVAVWNPARNVRKGSRVEWDKWKKLPLRTTGKGSFLAMTSNDWRKTGGFDERYCYGWGSEDHAFEDRQKALGIRIEVLDYPLAHVMHPTRSWKASKRTRRKIPQVPAEYTVNYLTDNLPRTRNVVLLVTSACPLSCADCSQEILMKADHDYQMSLREVDLFCDCVTASHKGVGRIDISGGEPLLWTNLREGIAKLNACEGIGPIHVFSSGMGKDEDLEWMAENVDYIRLSRHPNNWRRVKALRGHLKGRRAVVRISDKRQHIPMPTAPVPDTLPGSCVCPAVCYTRGRVYVCGNLPDLLVRHGDDWKTNPGLIEPIGPNFVDIRRYLGPSGANISWCSLCVGNRRVAKKGGIVEPQVECVRDALAGTV